MRKILAVVLAVMMLMGVLAVLPVSADPMVDAKTVSGVTNNRANFDGTSKLDSDGMNLVITEMLINSKTGNPDLDDQVASTDISKTASPDAFDFIEVYNRGTSAVNMNNIVIMSAPYQDFIARNPTGLNNAQYKFTMRNTLPMGDIHSAANGSAATAVTNGECSNPADVNGFMLNPGQFCVIWFWTADTEKLCAKLGNSVGKSTDGRTFGYFRDYYNIADDVMVLATNAKASKTNVSQPADVFNDLKANWVYALADATMEVGELAVTGTGNNKTLDSRIKCMAEYAIGTAAGIMSTDSTDDISAYYVPSGANPELYNAVQKSLAEADGKAFTAATNYVEIGYTRSFRETAVISCDRLPSPGSMPIWQWNYVHPGVLSGSSVEITSLADLEAQVYTDAVAAVTVGKDLKEIPLLRTSGLSATSTQNNNALNVYWNAYYTGDTTVTTANQAALVELLYNTNMAIYVQDWNDAEKNTYYKDANGRLKADTWTTGAASFLTTELIVEVGEDTNRTETKVDYSAGFVDRETLEERHNSKKKDNKKDGGGLPVWALILIIVGGVLVLGGVAVVIIIVIKKKNKPVAADDVAAEGEIQVIDETAAEDAPVEEAAEEAPAEETKEEN